MIGKNKTEYTKIMLAGIFSHSGYLKKITASLAALLLSLGGAFLSFEFTAADAADTDDADADIGEDHGSNTKAGGAFSYPNSLRLKLFDNYIYADEDLESIDDENLDENGDNTEAETEHEEENKITPEKLQRESFEFENEPLWDAENSRLTKEAEEKLTESFKNLEYSQIESNGDRSEDGKLLASIQLKNSFDLPLIGWELQFENDKGQRLSFKELKDNCFSTLPKEESVFVDSRLSREAENENLQDFKLKMADIYLLQDYKNLLHIIYDFQKGKIILSDRERAYYHESPDIDILKGDDLQFYYEDGRYLADWTSPYSSGLSTISWFFTDKNNNTLVASNARTLYYGHTQYDVFYEVHGRHAAGTSLEFDFASMKFVGMRTLLEYYTSQYYYYDANLNLFY